MRKGRDDEDRNAYLPSPTEIARQCAQIRRERESSGEVLGVSTRRYANPPVPVRCHIRMDCDGSNLGDD